MLEKHELDGGSVVPCRGGQCHLARHNCSPPCQTERSSFRDDDRSNSEIANQKGFLQPVIFSVIFSHSVFFLGFFGGWKQQGRQRNSIMWDLGRRSRVGATSTIFDSPLFLDGQCVSPAFVLYPPFQGQLPTAEELPKGTLEVCKGGQLRHPGPPSDDPFIPNCQLYCADTTESIVIGGKCREPPTLFYQLCHY